MNLQRLGYSASAIEGSNLCHVIVADGDRAWPLCDRTNTRVAVSGQLEKAIPDYAPHLCGACKRSEHTLLAAERAGCIEVRRSRATGTLVGLYRSAEAGMEEDPETPYTTVCEEHNTLVCHATLKLARENLPDPRGWCDECRDKKPRTSPTKPS